MIDYVQYCLIVISYAYSSFSVIYAASKNVAVWNSLVRAIVSMHLLILMQLSELTSQSECHLNSSCLSFWYCVRQKYN